MIMVRNHRSAPELHFEILTALFQKMMVETYALPNTCRLSAISLSARRILVRRKHKRGAGRK